VGAAVVEHRVAEDLEAGGLQRRNAVLERVLAAVGAVQVVQVPRPAISTARVWYVQLDETLHQVIATQACRVEVVLAEAMRAVTVATSRQHMDVSICSGLGSALLL